MLQAGSPPPPSGGISVPVAITLGLVASFIQSLGLTIQRKSHLHNESLPTSQRRGDWKRPLWVVGFLVFLCANLGGTIFQIGALPIVILAPLGAVSLLYNALLARFLLDDFFSAYMLGGTLLIATGAVMIGYFGVVQEPPHDLDRLLELFARPPFVAFVTVFLITFLGVLFIAHLAEWSLHTRLLREGLPSGSRRSSRHRKGTSSGGRRMQRSWSAPHLAPLLEVSESSSGVATPALAIADEAARRGLPIDRLLASGRHKQLSQQGSNSIDGVLAAASTGRAEPSSKPKKSAQAKNGTDPPAASPRRDYGTLPARRSHRSKPPRLDVAGNSQAGAAALNGNGGGKGNPESVVEKTKLGLAVTYGGASGTLSGACLLLAKSGVELVVLSLAGDNQFNRWQSYALVGTLLWAAVLQLWYLNKGLKLADPTLLCPLAFCFYNTSSIVLGLVYFDQLGALSGLSILMVVLGTAILLSGVWMVSMHGRSTPPEGEEAQPLLVSSESTESVDSSAPASSSTLVSPTDSSFMTSPTEMEAVLASNVAGIGGPHLPPAGALQEHDVEAHAGADGAAQVSPSGSPVRYRGLRRHTRSFSAASGLGGLGLAVPSFSPGRKLDGGGGGEVLPTTAPASSTSQQGNGGSSTMMEGSASVSEGPTSRTSRRKMMYQALLERGLSIGIGVSSPGFQLRSVLSPEEEEEAQEELMQRVNARGWARGGRRRFNLTAPEQRRSMSEADIGQGSTSPLGVGVTEDGAAAAAAAGEEMQRSVTEGGGVAAVGRGGHWFARLGRLREGGRKAGRNASPLGQEVVEGDEAESEVEAEDEDEEQRTAPSSAWYLGGGGGTAPGQQAMTSYSRMGATLDMGALSAKLGAIREGAARRGWRLLGRSDEEGSASGSGSGGTGSASRSRSRGDEERGEAGEQRG